MTWAAVMAPLNFCGFTGGGNSSLLILPFVFNLADIFGFIFSHFTSICQSNYISKKCNFMETLLTIAYMPSCELARAEVHSET